MTNTKFAVVGKVVNGQVRMVVASEDNRIVGKVRPVSYNNNGVAAQAVTVVADTTTTPVRKSIDSPFLNMVHENHKRHMAEKEARLNELYSASPKKQYSNWFNRIHDIRE